MRGDTGRAGDIGLFDGDDVDSGEEAPEGDDLTEQEQAAVAAARAAAEPEGEAS